MRVAFIGLGLMGSRMAKNLMAKGFEVVAYNRTRWKAEWLEGRGASLADTPRAAVSESEFICTCVADPTAMRQVFRGENGIEAGISRGKMLIDFSTVGPATTMAVAAACADREAEFLEAPVTGSKTGAENGTLVLMCGGSAEAFEKAQPILNAVGKKSVHVGEVGQASYVKLVGNMLIAHMMEGLNEGAALIEKAGIPMAKLLEVVQSSGYASPYWEFKADALIAQDFETHFSIDLMYKDLSLALETGHKLGVPMPGTAAMREIYSMAQAHGLGEKDIVATAAIVNPALAKGM